MSKNPSSNSGSHLGPLCELMDVGYHHVGVDAVRQVGVGVERRDEGAAGQVGQHSDVPVEARLTRHVERLTQLSLDGEVRGNHEYSAASDPKRQKGDQSSLATPNRNLLHGAVATTAKERPRRLVTLHLGDPQVDVACDSCGGILEEVSYLFVRKSHPQLLSRLGTVWPDL
jgi:hypothetical protein